MRTTRKGTVRTTTGISLPAELKRAAELQARREHRSLSSLISFALARYLREVGAWKEAEVEATEGPPEAR
jgi:predicted transcriptional regulator